MTGRLVAAALGSIVVASLTAGRADAPAPRLVGEGIVSSPADEFGGQLDADGATLFFNRSVPRSQLYAIFTSRFERGSWTAPEVAPFSGRWRDFDAVLGGDGRRLFFISDRPNGSVRGRYRVWMLERGPSGFGEPKPLPPNVNTGDVHFASSTRDGTLYFTASRDGNLGLVDVYRSRLLDGDYAPPENLGPPINGSGFWNLEAFVAADESFLILSAAGRPDGLGDSDLYVSFRQGGVWGPVRNLGPRVNSPARDYSPRVVDHGRILAFASERGLPTDPRDHAFSYRELVAGIRSVRNGLGNLYEIDLADAMP